MCWANSCHSLAAAFPAARELPDALLQALAQRVFAHFHAVHRDDREMQRECCGSAKDRTAPASACARSDRRAAEDDEYVWIQLIAGFHRCLSNASRFGMRRGMSSGSSAVWGARTALVAPDSARRTAPPPIVLGSGAAAPEEVNHQGNHRQNYQEVNQPAGNVEREKPQQPQYQQNHKQSEKHLKPPLYLLFNHLHSSVTLKTAS